MLWAPAGAGVEHMQRPRSSALVHCLLHRDLCHLNEVVREAAANCSVWSCRRAASPTVVRSRRRRTAASRGRLPPTAARHLHLRSPGARCTFHS
eukprot:scaffold91380_cov61-Phaeocystis_antarctica.AAC.1